MAMPLQAPVVGIQLEEGEVAVGEVCCHVGWDGCSSAGAKLCSVNFVAFCGWQRRLRHTRKPVVFNHPAGDVRTKNSAQGWLQGVQ